MLRYFLAWFPLVVIGFVNATVRQVVYGPHVTGLAAHQISTLTICVLVGVYGWLIFGWLDVRSAGDALRAGFVWLVLTAAFEFGLGHYVLGDSWANLLQDYNVLQGRVWGVFLLWVTVAPYVFYGLWARRGKKRS